MIRHGTVKFGLGSSWGGYAATIINGYYLVLPCGNRYWLGRDMEEAACNLEKVCEKHLTEQNFQYWIDYCIGLDVNQKLAWTDIDFSEDVLDQLAKFQ